MQSSNLKGGTGFVARDYRGRDLEAKGMQFHSMGDTGLMEAPALHKAVQFSTGKGYEKVVYERDAKAIIDCINLKSRKQTEAYMVAQEASQLATTRVMLIYFC